MEDILNTFPEETARIMRAVLDSEEGELIIESQGENIVISCSDELCFTWKLILANASGLPEQTQEGRMFWCKDLRREAEQYVLSGEVEATDCFHVDIRFSGAYVDVEAKRTDLVQQHMKPWMHLSAMAHGILRKSEIAPDLIHAQEQRLLPLLREITLLTCWQGLPKDQNGELFPLLRKRLAPKLHKYLNRLEQSWGSWDKYLKASNQLQTLLNRSEYEPVWRELFEQIAASQAEYPLKIYASEGLRCEIEAMLHSCGYSGAYPDFVKRGAVRGLHIRKSHEMSYFIFNEKHAVFHIHCREYPGWNDGLLIEFICGTEFLRKDDKPGDIWSCLFDAQGRRLVHTVSCFDEDDLSLKAATAVKKAELRRLTKDERKADGDIPFGMWSLLFFLFVLLAGGFFAVFIMIGMALMVLLICLFVGGWSSVPEMFTALPWMELFWFSLLAFGGVMGIVEVIAARNSG